jgi:hypothetical protein
LPYSDPAARPAGNDPNPIHVGFADPFRQQRLTVLVRAILLIPHLIVLAVLGIAAEVVAFIGWFAALFTGRLPDFAADFLVGYLRWDARVLAYHLLLTGEYPPFSLDDARYPVRLAAAPGRLNRLAVLFRVILAIPAALLNALLSFGAFTVASFVTWLIVLINGAMPVALHQALSAAARYSLRYAGYVLLVTSQYPAGVFGDQPGQAAGSPPGTAEGDGIPTASPEPDAPSVPGGQNLAAAEGTQQAPVLPSAAVPPPTAYPQPGSGQQASWPAPGATAGYPAPAAGAMPAAPPWPLVLSGAARKLVGLFMALGLVFLAGYVVLIVVLISNSSSTLTRQQAITQVQAAQAQANVTLTKYSAQISACNSAPDALHCATSLDKQAASALGTFASTIKSLSMPSAAASAAAGQLADAATSSQQAFARLSTATSLSQYESIQSSVNFTQLSGQLSQQFQALGTALSASP